jgi:hypothetical protein
MNITVYNNHNYDQLSYDTTSQSLIKDGKPVRWRTQTFKVPDKNGVVKEYRYEVALVKDVEGHLHKIFKIKFISKNNIFTETV